MDWLNDVICCFCNEGIQREIKYQRVYRYLKKYDNVNISPPVLEKCNSNVHINKTIWVCWFQGLENAPELVKCCVDSISRMRPEEYDLIIITEGNVSDYIKFPSFIENKYREGLISKTHLSDIIRTELLYAYGGCWIDATVYCSNVIPEYMLSGFFVFKGSTMDKCKLPLSSWWIAADKGCEFIKKVRAVLYCYWQSENSLKDYFLYHIICDRVINRNSRIKYAFLDIPYFNNSMPHILQGRLPREFEQEDWDIIKSNCSVHKLTYKNKYIVGDTYNYYTALLDGKLV